MAVTVTVLKNSHKDAIVKVSGTSATGTIDISTLLSDNQALTVGGTPTVSITGFHVNALSGATVTVTRNSVDILNIPGPNIDTVQFNQYGFVDNIEDDQDIAVAIAGAAAQIYLFLRKTDGFSSTHEPAYFGAYDDITAVGS
jgi:hypothetical protein